MVMLKVDQSGEPLGAPEVLVDQCDNHLEHNPNGSLVRIVKANDCSIFITEDHNGTLLRLS